MRLPILAWLIVVVSVTSASGQTPQGPMPKGKGSTPHAAPSVTKRVFRARQTGRH